MKLIFFISLFFIFFCGNTIADGYTVIGDTVFINDSNVYLSASPHTLSGSGWVYFNLTSKVYTGNIDVVWGFNTSVTKPKQAVLYNPYWINTTTNHEKTFHNPTFNVYEGDNLDYGNSYNINYKYTIIEEIVNGNGTVYITSNASFDSFDVDGANYTIYWYTRHDNHYLWEDYSASFNSVIYDYEGFDKWYYIKNVPVNSGINYTVKGWIDIPVSLEIQEGKYYFAIKPSHETISQAVNNGHFYNLDPWWNAAWSNRKNITLTGGASGAQTDYQLKLTIPYDSDMQTDFDDLRFTESDGTTLIDAWLESKTDSSTADIWVEFPTTPANGITEDYYIYYGNSGVSNIWNGNNTFIKFEDFESYINGENLHNVNSWHENNQYAVLTASNLQIKSGSLSGRWYRYGSDIRKGAFWDFNTKTDDFIIEYDYKKQSDLIIFGTCSDLTPSWGSSTLLNHVGKLMHRTSSNTYIDILNPFDFSWHKFTEIHHPSTKTFDLKINDGLTYNGSGLTYNQQENPRYLKFVDPTSNAGYYEAFFDNIRIRKYASHPPTYSFNGIIIKEDNQFKNTVTTLEEFPYVVANILTTFILYLPLFVGILISGFLIMIGVGVFEKLKQW